MLYLITSILSIFLIMAGASFFSVLWHETGHAIPLLFWTKSGVTIYVGSFGDSRKSFRIRIGRLELFCKYNPLLWLRGLCRSQASELLSVNKRIVYIAAGPIASLILTLGCWYFFQVSEPIGLYKFALGCLLWISVVFTFSSGLPRSNSYFNNKGLPTYNDAKNILLLLEAKRLPPDYTKAAELCRLKQYKEGAVLLDGLIDTGTKKAAIYRLAVGAHLMSKNYERGMEICEVLRKSFAFNADDCVNEGYFYNKTHEPEKAIAHYQRALYLSPKHIYAMNNIGYSMILLQDAENAIPYFDKVIRMSPNFFHAYNNRGLAYMLTGDFDRGLADVNRALSLDDSQGEIYRNLGFYHMEKGDLAKAQELLEKAKGLEEDMPLIDDYLIRLRALQEMGLNK